MSLAHRFFLVRHAQADWQPDETRSLSHQGRVDAERIADILASEPVVAIYSSPYRRARETVEPLARRLGMVVEEMADLRERSLGTDWESDWEATIRSTWENFSLAYPEGGETNAEALKRARRAYLELSKRHRDEEIVVATHGNLLVLMLRLLDPTKGFDFWRRLSQPDIYRLDVDGSGAFELQRLWHSDYNRTGDPGQQAMDVG